MKNPTALPFFGLVLSAALATAGAAPSNTTDVLVVGSGGAGMGAAIAAREAGADVIMIEKLAMVGGTTLLSSTAFNAGGSQVQMAMEKPYTADDYFKKLETGANGKELETRLSERHELEKPERLDGVGLFTVLDLELK